jgi:quercetin dioxygenase-like cupin family protein
VSRQVKQFEEGRMKSGPTQEHEHGNQTSWMTHIAIQKKKDGKVVDWMEHVTDEQYHSGESNPH